MSKFQVKKVAVLGAGVMGAQIAAHLVNVRVPVLLFDLAAKEGPKNGIITRAIDNLKKIKPSPLGVTDDALLIEAANYDDDLARLAECDLVIEAIAERMDWKHDLYKKIAPHVAAHAILASNTSGLSIAQLGDGLPEALKPRFCGIHFFNPPRYMTLVELIATPATDARVLDDLETSTTSTLGKGVIRAKDTPNFIANRIGIAGLLATLKEAEKFGLTPEVVDDLTGKKLGRASSGTFRTADVVGLDTMAHVIETMQNTLDEKCDPFYPVFAMPPTLAKLIELGHLGQKTKAGFYKKVGRDILRFDLAAQDYVPTGAKADEVYAKILKRPPAERMKLLRESEGAQGQFLWAILRDSFHYAAVHLADIADNARDVDLAMRRGFRMKQGPFELCQEAGWAQTVQWIQEDIDAGKALCSAPLPRWVFEGPVAQAGGVHTPEGSWSPSANRFVAPRCLPVHARQLFPESVFGSGAVAPAQSGTTLRDEGDVRLWTLDGEVLIATLHSKMNAISPDICNAMLSALDLAERDYKGLVIWSPREQFSVGADLQAVLPAFMAKGASAIDEVEQLMQKMMLRIRYASVPVISAVHGLALGGGCELAVYSAQRVAAMESYIGLVEVGVGLVPGAGGLTYIARRAAERAQSSVGTDLLPFLIEGFTAAAMAKVGTSAPESRKLGYLLDSDVIVPHTDEVLYVALQQVRALHESGWRPPMKRLFKVAGRSGAATICGQLINMLEGGFISEHDMRIARHIAEVVTGGDVDPGTLVSEEYLMTLERRAFCALVVHPKTQERIMAILSTGKPLRN
ncbi:MAG: 3-hydroxyacyl-CoA dehydrogenase/enoyl-CoA hydratase family protein [Burkholderiaceae bacterium]|jgi:3-hydroxyacyl-CoA dehydrogenase|nr:3-hydroxyacyl-CoA dehydrogenase/enoyl-CoA hydratase family protein [Burkholderiaceae bacterium]